MFKALVNFFRKKKKYHVQIPHDNKVGSYIHIDEARNFFPTGYIVRLNDNEFKVNTGKRVLVLRINKDSTFYTEQISDDD